MYRYFLLVLFLVWFLSAPALPARRRRGDGF